MLLFSMFIWEVYSNGRILFEKKKKNGKYGKKEKDEGKQRFATTTCLLWIKKCSVCEVACFVLE